MSDFIDWERLQIALESAFKVDPNRILNLIAKNEEQYALRFLNVKNCPFCDSKPQIVTETTVFKNMRGGIDWDQVYYGICCSNTMCWASDNANSDKDTLGEAVESWNTRCLK